MQTYELTLVLVGSLDTDKQKAALDKLEKIIKESNGSVLKRDDLGKKNLAQTVKKNKEGVYVFYHLELEEARVNPIARLIENDDNVLRHLMIKGIKDVRPSKETKVTEKEVKAEKEVKKPKKEVKEKVKTKKSKVKTTTKKSK